MQDIYEYIKLPLEQRQSHLDLTTECLLLSDKKSTSVHHASRGILAWVAKTTIPSGMSIQLCHACNNKLCSNPNHLYWGTPKENHQDQVDAGTYKSFKTRMIDKHGEEVYKQIMKANGSKGGRANRNKAKSEEHKQKISKSLTK